MLHQQLPQHGSAMVDLPHWQLDQRVQLGYHRRYSRKNRHVLIMAKFLLSLVAVSASALAATNSVTIKETSGAAQTNRPFTISRVFAKGEIAHFPKAVIGGAQVNTQADVKTRWPDGSVQHAMISFLASVSAGASITVDFVDQPS